MTLNFESIRLSPRDTKDFIMQRIEFGVELRCSTVSHTFNFFGCSNLQMRGRKAVLVRLSPSRVESLLGSMGDFNMNSVAKREKRIGLLFSSSGPIVELPPLRVEDIDDLTCKSGALLTDGCGFISKAFASRIAKEANLAYRCQRYLPSVYQIRYSGYKGVVSLQPSMPKEFLLQCRPSMNKFKNAASHMFGLVAASKPYSFGALNAEHVTLLVEMGVDPQILLEKQGEYHEFLIRAVTNTEDAFQLLVYKGHFDATQQLLEQGLTEVGPTVKRAVCHELEKGVNKRGERKVRIVLINSRLLFGIAEPESRLGVSEVFVRITIGGLAQTLTDGYVLVTRNPCLHPGDIRFLKCVDIEEYHHLVDCVVFLTNDQLHKSHAEEMSGGDLDGDTFMVIFNVDITSCKIVFKPYEYPPAKQKPQGGINRKDRMMHFARFNNSSVGRIKNVYLKWVAEHGARCRQALELNALFSACVDGEFKPIPNELLQAPEPSEASNDFVVNRLIVDAETFVNQCTASELIVSSEVASYHLLESLVFYDNPVNLSLFELFRFVQRCSHLDVGQRKELCAGIDFSLFSFIERNWTIKRLPFLRPMMSNDLHMSELLPQSELCTFPFLEQGNWKLLYTSRVPGPALHDRISTALCYFVRKLIVLRAGPDLTLVLFVNQRVGMGANDIETLHVFSTSGRGFKSHAVLRGFCLDMDHHLVEIYRSAKRGTFVWLATRVNEKDYADGLVGKVGVDLRRLGNKAEKQFALVTKQPLTKVEIYVLASEDSRALRIRHYPIGHFRGNLPSVSQAEVFQCREYREETEHKWLASPMALPEIVEVVRNHGQIDSNQVDGVLMRTVLASSHQYNLHELLTDLILMYPECAAEAIRFLSRLPYLAVPLAQLGRGEGILLFRSLLRCLSDRRWAALALEHITLLLPKIEQSPMLEHMCLCSVVSSYATELRDLVITLFHSRRGLALGGSDSAWKADEGEALGVFVDLQCTLCDSFEDTSKPPVLQYLHLEFVNDGEAGLYAVKRIHVSNTKKRRRLCV